MSAWNRLIGPSALLVVWLASGGALHAERTTLPSVAAPACGLLAAEEILAVQGTAVSDRKGSAHARKGLRFAQCVFATTDFAHSVSLTMITADAGSAGANPVRAYWDDTFRERGETRRGKGGRTKEREPSPRPILKTGDQAYWTGGARSGALYVLSGEAVLRISVGGVSDESERIRRSQTLARAALSRLGMSH